MITLVAFVKKTATGLILTGLIVFVILQCPRTLDAVEVEQKVETESKNLEWDDLASEFQGVVTASHMVLDHSISIVLYQSEHLRERRAANKFYLLYLHIKIHFQAAQDSITFLALRKGVLDFFF